MMASRVVSIFLRFFEFVCAAIVLGIMAYFVQRRNRWGGPRAREIYTLVIASLSVLFSLIWMIPTTGSMMHYPLDLLASAAWFAAFGILIDWMNDNGCGGGGVFYWNDFSFRGSRCGQWRAAEAFSFISAILWFVSCLLGAYVYHKVTRREQAAAGGTHRRRWGRSHV